MSNVTYFERIGSSRKNINNAAYLYFTKEKKIYTETLDHLINAVKSVYDYYICFNKEI